MFKEIVYSSHETRNGRPYRTIYPVFPGQTSFSKTAEASDLDPEVKAFISGLAPDPAFIYVVAVALGAGESWSSNVNGDYFSRKDLMAKHQTFVTNGKVFHLHDNKPTSKSYGSIAHSRYNPTMDRVELVFTISRADLPDVVRQIEAGECVDVSMGTKVEFDVCSICGKQSKRFSEYCSHLKYEMNKIYPDGRKVYADNPNPGFFDISIVDVGADRTAKVLAKVASSNPGRVIHSALLGEKLAAEKDSTMDKYEPVDPVERALPDKLKLYWTALGDDADSGCDFDARGMSSSLGINDILNMLTNDDMVLRPHEFSSLLFDRMGMRDLADDSFKTRSNLSSPDSLNDSDQVKIMSNSGELPINLPNHYSVERKMSPNSMSMRFRMMAGGKLASAKSSYLTKSASGKLDSTVISMYRTYVKQASRKIIKKANMELLGFIPKILAAVLIGKALLEPGNSDILPGNTMNFKTVDIMGVPTNSMAKDLDMSQSEMMSIMKKEMDMLDKIKRGGDPRDMMMFKASRASLAPVHTLSNCFNMLKLSGLSDTQAAREISHLSPTANALAMTLNRNTLANV